MKKIIYVAPVVAAIVMGGCSKDNPFGGETSGEGQVLKSSLMLSKAGGDIMIDTRAGEGDVDTDRFQVSFMQEGSTQAFRSYAYGEMPEVVTLPAGGYKVLATLGEDREAEWENPYYKGESADFEVRANEITSDIAPVVCELQNVKVTIDFDPVLKSLMGGDAYVEVRVGDSGSLKYTTAETDAGKAGYFRYTAENTLVATFYGTVDDGKVVATKSYTDVRGGCWYKLTFRLHTGDGSGTGTAQGEVSVDASVDVEDVNADVTIAEDEPMDDKDRPTWGGGSDEPETPKVPEITADGTIKFDTPNEMGPGDECVLHIHSSAEGGITAFTCDIISDNLTEDALKEFGLDSHLDLVNTPDAMAAKLSGLGFPTNVGGKNEVEFNLTKFIPMMAAFENEPQTFVLTVTDANGTTKKTLILVCHN